MLIEAMPVFDRKWLRSGVMVKPKSNKYNTDPKPIRCYAHWEGRTGLPYHLGMQTIAKMGWGSFCEIVDERISAQHEHKFTRFPDPHHERAPQGQEPFMRDLETAVARHQIFSAQGDTGVGKTVCLLNAWAKTRERGVIIVPSIYIAKQWADEAAEHLGLSLSQIGRIGDGKCKWEGYPLTIAVIHNLFTGALPLDFYRSYGFVGFDEAHRLGARLFSNAAGLFHARYRVALSATYTRKDGCSGVIYSHLGKPLVEAAAVPMETDAWVVDFSTTGKVAHPKMPMARQLTFLTADAERNGLLTRLIRKQYDKGRNIVVFSDRVEHLADLRWRAEHEAGIPPEKLGIFAAQYADANGARYKISQAELTRVKAESQVIFATYPMMKEAVDIPRLDCGIEATPKGDNIQGIGRVRRYRKGKRKPRWIIIRDTRASLPMKRMVAAGITKLEETRNIHIHYYGTATHID